MIAFSELFKWDLRNANPLFLARLDEFGVSLPKRQRNFAEWSVALLRDEQINSEHVSLPVLPVLSRWHQITSASCSIDPESRN